MSLPLGEREAELCRGWITNRRRPEQVVAQMEISLDEGELLLRQRDDSKQLGSAKH